MSNQRVKFEAVVDPHVRVAKEFSVDVRDGPAQISYFIDASQSKTSVNQTFTITPAPNQGLGRYVSLRMTGSTVITTTTKAIAAGSFGVAMRAWPIMAAMDSCTVSINGVAVSTSNVRQIRKAWARIANPAENQTGVQSTSTTACDQVSRYADAPTDSQNSIFSAVIQRGDGVYPSRMLNITDVVYSAGNQVATVTWDIIEPLTVPPFIASTDRSAALFGLSGNVTIQYVLNSVGINNMLSVALTGPDKPTFSTIATTLTAQELHYQLYTPTNNAVEKIPPQWYHMPLYNLNTSSSYTITSQADGTVAGRLSSNTFILNQVPRLLVIWVEQKDQIDSASSCLNADFCVPIEKLQIDFLSKQGLLVGASRDQLYQMSINAGLRASYNEFTGGQLISGAGLVTAATSNKFGFGVGTPVVIDCSQLDLPDDIVPGTTTPTTVRVQADINGKNIYGASTAVAASATAAEYVLQVLAVSPSYLQIYDRAALYVQGGITPADAAAARKAPAVRAAAFELAAMDGTLAGGSFFSDFVKGFGKAAEIGLPLVEKFAGAGGASMTQKAASSLRERLMRS